MQVERNICFPAGKGEGTPAVTDMMERYAGGSGASAWLTTRPLAVWLCVLCHLIQGLQVALLAPGNRASPAVLSTSGNVPTQQFILLPVQLLLRWLLSLALAAISQNYIYTPYDFVCVNLFLRKSAYLVLKFGLANKSYQICVGTWLV